MRPNLVLYPHALCAVYTISILTENPPQAALFQLERLGGFLRL